MSSIFLSYAHEDRPCVERLARVLESAGHQVWWDRRLDAGKEFSAEIEAELDRSDVVLVAWSKASVKSRWVRDEAAVGVDTGRLMPVSIDKSQPPMGFRQFHTIDLAGWKDTKRDKRTAELLHSLERRLKGSDVSPPISGVETKRHFTWAAGKRLWALAAVALFVVAAGVSIVLLNGRASLGGPLPKPTIALLPFTTTSTEADLRDIAAQAQGSVSHALSQTGIPVRLLRSPSNDQSAGDFLLSGELSKTADKIVATIRLDEVTQGVTVMSHRIEASREEIADLPERMGAQIASSFVASNLMILDRRHPISPALMAELLAPATDGLQAYQNSKRVAAKAPEVAAAQIGVAFSTGFVLDELPRAARPAAVAEARRAVQKGLILAPDFGDTHAAWCLLQSEVWKAECEDHLRRGNRTDPDAPYLNNFLSSLLLGVGRFDESLEVTKLAYTHDPYDAFKIGAMLRMLEFAGDRDGARRLYKDGVRWWPEDRPRFFQNRLIGLLYHGDFVAIERLEQEVGSDAFPPDYRKSGAIAAAVKSRSKPNLRRACDGGEGYLLMGRCMIAFTMIQDLDGAYEVAERFYPRRLGRTPAETEQIWLDNPGAAGPSAVVTAPAAAPMRRDPRFLELAQRIGLLPYWRTGRAPDFCRKTPEPICPKILK